MKVLPRTLGRVGLLLSVITATTCSVSVAPKPTLGPVTAVAWDLGKQASYAQVAAAALTLAPSHGYDILETTADRLVLVSSRTYGAEIDEYCIYPVTNATTGGRMYTFASWQMEMNRSPSLRGRVEGRVLVEFSAADYGVRVRSNCRAFTQLGLQPAESKGVHEKELLNALRRQLGSSPASEPRAEMTGEAAKGEASETESRLDTTSPCDLDAELRKLDKLRKDDLLTDQEFENQKRKLLARCG